jgi:acetylornithine deacetylase/succinyl-diaminopimelate desuccinylase-like protein
MTDAPSMEWIERVIRVNSITTESNSELVALLIPLIKQVGLKVEEQRVVENGIVFKNIIAYSHSNDTPNLFLLNTHLDTVSYGRKEDWTRTQGDPFQATRVRDRVYGLGTADVQLDFLCKIWGARQAKPWSQPFVLVGTFGEERGLVGAEKLMKEKKIKARYALVGEPSNLELVYAHKGRIVFTMATSIVGNSNAATKKQWRGKTAHTSTPAYGDNAIKKALTDILKRGYGIVSLEGGTDSNKVPEQCDALCLSQQTESTQRILKLSASFDELQKELNKRRDTRFSPSLSTVSLNMARTIGNELKLTFDLRVLPDVDTERLLEKLTIIAKRCLFKLQDVGVSLPLKGRKEGALMSAACGILKSCGVKPARKTQSFSTEAAIFRQYGIESLVFGPGDSAGNIHKPNEHNSLRQIAIATQFYTGILNHSFGAT